jgi:hypothetical protein
MLWVAPTNRHSDRAAALPLRMNRSIFRLEKRNAEQCLDDPAGENGRQRASVPTWQGARC